jgi:hypothetical protein
MQLVENRGEMHQTRRNPLETGKTAVPEPPIQVVRIGTEGHLRIESAWRPHGSAGPVQGGIGLLPASSPVFPWRFPKTMAGIPSPLQGAGYGLFA